MPNQFATDIEKVESQTTETAPETLEEQVSEAGVVEETVEEGEATPPTKKKTSETVPIQRFNEVWGQMRRLERLSQQLLEERKSFTEQSTKKPEPEPDYDQMTPKELVGHITQQVGRVIDDRLSKTLTPLQEDRRLEQATASITHAASKYPDFWDFKEQMIEVAERHPTLSAEQAYLLASGNKGAAGDKILDDLQTRIKKKKQALTEKRSSPVSRQTKERQFGSVREGALAAAKELGFDVE